jgi:hypothetical protein
VLLLFRLVMPAGLFAGSWSHFRRSRGPLVANLVITTIDGGRYVLLR